MNQKAISTIIATVLLIMMTMVAAVIIGVFVIPMVRENLSKGDCFKTVGKIVVLEDSLYSCYNASGTNVMIEVGFLEDVNITGVAVSLVGEGKSQSYKIKEGFSDPSVSMLGGGSVEAPNPGEAQTYVFDLGFNATLAEVSAILGERVCDQEFFTLPECAS